MDSFHRPWVESYDAEVPPNLDYERLPMHEYLDRAARKWPNRKAIIFQNWSCTYAKLKQLSGVFAANLKKQGLKRGDRVALMLPNLPQTLIAYWGTLRAGGVVTMVNPLYMETEIVHQFNDSGARFLITLDMLWPKLQKLLPDLPTEKYFFTSIADSLRFPLNWLYKFKTAREGKKPAIPFDGKKIQPFKPLVSGRKTFTCDDIDPDEMAMLQYTGGTTGIAKGCILTHFNLGANVQQCSAMLSELSKDPQIFLGVLPYFHIYGLTTCCTWPISIGATLIPFPRYVPQDVLKGIHKHRPTVFPGAPSVYISLLQQKNVAKFDLKSIQYCVSGSAPMPVEYIEGFYEMTGAKILEGFGLTEASPVTHLNPIRGERKNGSIGLPFPDTDAKIVDMEVAGDPLPVGKMGELVIRGPQVMKGYYNRPDATADVLRNGWLFTGDIGYMDEDGYFFIVDRKKDLIISGGYNIYPREVDEVLYAHPDIREAVTVGIPHPQRGEIVKAYIVLEPGVKMSRSDVISFCREKLANYKVPKQVEFRKELPKTMVGKVLRRALREEEIEKAEKRKEKNSK
ncbi:long-chain-fatty-acid--CoA ligase [Desulfovibrio oxyclinae]|uniref:long-chain-fatty-acid--CoA ligase n=1 Tax=Desulfovibrio oxyclinae TaxID=63560 RepID=UPI000364D317|nr:long-chain fatty acid--CoA ligase [Desulfovibrio oxyclinae]